MFLRLLTYGIIPFCFQVVADQNMAKALYLKSLTSAQVSSFDLLDQSESQLFILFQKNCSSCARQVKELQCLPKQLKIRLVGLGDREASLRDELIKMKTQIPAYWGSVDAIRTLGFEPFGTPQLALFVKGRVKRWLGYRHCREIIQILQDLGEWS